MFTVEIVMSQTELFFLSYEKNIGLNTCRIALIILRVIYGIDDITFD